MDEAALDVGIGLVPSSDDVGMQRRSAGVERAVRRGAGLDEEREGEVVGAGVGSEHGAVEGDRIGRGFARGEASDEGIVVERGGVGEASEEGLGVGEVGEGGAGVGGEEVVEG